MFVVLLNKLLSIVTIISCVFSVSLCYATDIEALLDNINNRKISLDIGQWSNLQTVHVGGVDIKKAELSDTYCLMLSDSIFTAKDYANKLMADIGQEADCDVSNMQGNEGEITFQLECSSSASNFITKMDMSYDYSQEKIHVKGEGTVEGGGFSARIKVDSLARKIGECEEENLG